MRFAIALAGAVLAAPAGAPASRVALDVPALHGPAHRCGPIAFRMVLRWYGAADSALAEGERAYDEVLRGTLVTELAQAARRAGYTAAISTPSSDSLVAWLAAGIPPIVLYQNGRGPLTVPHYGVVTGWDPARDTFTLNDGGARPAVMRRAEFDRRWRKAGSQALVIRRPAP